MREPQRPNRGAMKKVVVINVIHEAGLRILRAREDVAVSVVAEPDAERVRQEVAEAHGIIVRTFPIDWALIEAAPRLEAVSRHGVGYDNVDVAALDARRVPLTIVGDVNAVPVAEQALFMMLALAKKGAALDRAVRTGEFAKRDSSGTTELWRKTVLILGFGRIGRQVSARCRAFGMIVLAYDPYVEAATIEAGDGRAVEDFRSALGEADYVTLHMPLGLETANMIGGAELAAMKPSACLINVARGGLAGEAALYAALRDGGYRRRRDRYLRPRATRVRQPLAHARQCHPEPAQRRPERGMPRAHGTRVRRERARGLRRHDRAAPGGERPGAVKTAPTLGDGRSQPHRDGRLWFRPLFGRRGGNTDANGRVAGSVATNGDCPPCRIG